jgi:hypothetical protein
MRATETAEPIALRFPESAVWPRLFNYNEYNIQHQMASPLPPHAKPMRLALACNQCRKRKVRCDARQPKCTNCEQRGEICEARNPKKASQITDARQRGAKVSTPPSFGTQGRPRQASIPASPPHSVRLSPCAQSDRHSIASAMPRTKQVNSPTTQRPQHRPWTKDHISWLTRAYHQTSGEAGKEDTSHQLNVDGDSTDQNSAFSPDVVMTKDGKVKVCPSSLNISFLQGPNETLSVSRRQQLAMPLCFCRFAPHKT